MVRVYLSGGLRTGWQDTVMENVVGCAFYDPRTVNTEALNLRAIAQTKLRMIDQSDIVFVYHEEDNPSGLGLGAEVGYALARGVPVIYVDERNDRYTAFTARGLATLYTTDFGAGIMALQDMVRALNV